VSVIIPLHLRPVYGGILGSLEALAVIVGPIIGGALATNVGWQWCFWINLPAGAILSAAILFFFKPSKAKVNDLTLKQLIIQLDLISGLSLIACITCLLLALEWAGTKYDWSNGRIVALLTIFGALLIAIVFDQGRKKDAATIPARLFKNRSFLCCIWYGFCIAGSQFVLIYNVGARFPILILKSLLTPKKLPIWFQFIKNATASESGRMLLPSVVAVIVGGLIAGGGATALGYLPPFMITGAILTSVGSALIYTFSPDTPRSQWIGYQAVYGIGCGMGIQQPLVGVQVALAQQDIPIGTASVMLGNTLGGAIFITVSNNVFISQLKYLAEIIPGLDTATIINSGLTALRGRLTPDQMRDALVQYNKAIQKAFLVAVVLSCCSIFGAAFIKWDSLKKKKSGDTGQTAESEPTPTDHAAIEN
jgi:hypothetical protein